MREYKVEKENIQALIHQDTKAIQNRLSIAIGHLKRVRQMVEEGKDCSEVLIQLSAVKAAVNNTGNIVLKDFMERCITEAVENGDSEAMKELTKAIDRFLK